MIKRALCTLIVFNILFVSACANAENKDKTASYVAGMEESSTSHVTNDEYDVNRTITYSEVTKEDLETIEYVYQNSDCVFKLLDEMVSPQIGEEGPCFEIGGDNMEIECYGVRANEDGDLLRFSVTLMGASDYHILGVHNGETYRQARQKIEDAGFTWEEDRFFNSNTKWIIFTKGNVEVSFMAEESGEDGIDDDVIDYIDVKIPIREYSSQ